MEPQPKIQTLEQRIKQAAETQHEGAAFILGAEWMLAEVQPLLDASKDLVDSYQSKNIADFDQSAFILSEVLAKFRGEDHHDKKESEG